MKRVCIVTTTRADWGLLMPLAARLRTMDGIRLSIVASNMHLMPEYGMTVDEIRSAGFTVDECVDMRVEGDDEASRVRAMALCTAGMADAFSRLKPDAAILLGDRYEMLAVASAAAVMHIPIVHIAGGEVSEGAVDDCIRHAITKLAALHLTATEEYRKRVIQMGEDPGRVINTGAIGVWNANNIIPLTKEELEESIGMCLDGDVAVLTYHPATNDPTTTPAERTRQLLEALTRFPQLKIIITAPNNDAGGASCLPLLHDYAQGHPGRVVLVESLGMVRYHSVLRHAALVIGNSSSGIVEVPSAGIPTVDIGIRQRGRLAADSVIHCDTDTDSISKAISRALSPEMREKASRTANPYYRPDTLEIMTESIINFIESMPAGPKHFYDINFK